MMIKNAARFLTGNGSLLLLVTFLVVSTGLLVFWQYRYIQDSRAQIIPLDTGTTVVNTTTTEGGSTGMQTDGSQPVSITLGEGQSQPQSVEPVPQATGEPLPEGDIELLLARLPELAPEAGDQQDFNLSGEPIPPPRTGETIQQSFPPPPEELQRPEVASGPLEVLRYSPEGEVSIAPFVNITFNQPMVPLTALSDLAAMDVPVKIDPPLEGTWRWLGTRVLNFQYDSALIDRLPKATVYHVTIPAGTKSATGGVLAKAVEWTFSTPAPKVTFSYPSYSPQNRDPIFFIQFDQRIDPAAVLNSIKVNANGQYQSLQLLDEAAVRANDKTKDLLTGTAEGRWLAFKAQELLPADSDVTVIIGPGTPSAEGPLVTQEVQTYSFRTFAPLKVVDHGCSWGGSDCQPLSPFYIRFNNPLDGSRYDDTMLRITPALPGASINIMGDTIQIQGESKGQTTYTVILSGSIQDTFGQTLGQETRLTFRVGRAEPVLFGSGETFITLDPAAKKPVFSVYTINYSSLDVKVYAVQPSDWPAYKTYLQNYQRTDINVEVPGRKVMDQVLRVEAATDTLTQVDIDLSSKMDGASGNFIVIVRPPQELILRDANRYWQTVQAWVQVTQIGLDAFVDYSDMVVWATALKDGSPLEGVKITSDTSTEPIATSSDGTARFSIPNGATYLVAALGADKALLPRSNYAWGNDSWNSRYVPDSLRWYVFDDREMYRPGEEIHFKGWLRGIGGKQDGDVKLVGSSLTAVNYQINDSTGNSIGQGRVETNALGGFDFTYTVPDQVNLGYAQVYFSAEGNLGGFEDTQYYYQFQIQEFRRPEFEVSARNESPAPYFAGEKAVVAVEAKYYAGGALPNADVTWQVSSSTGHYAPPNWPQFTFGSWTPWWWNKGYFYEYSSGPYGDSGAKVETFTGKTDAAGEHYLSLQFGSEGSPTPLSVTAQATVMDVNRQAWTGTTSLLVHPASLYVGIRSDRYFVERGTPLKIDFIVTDLDGNPVTDRPVTITAARLDWKYRNGTWAEEEADVQTCTQGSQSTPGTCTFNTPVGGTYRITAVITDPQGRKNQSQFTRWVSGGQIPPARKVEQETVTLIPDKETYQPGDVAQILVQSPFSPAEGLLTVNRSGLISTERFRIEDGTITLSVPIEESYIPNLHLQVDLTGSAPRVDDQGNTLSDVAPRPAYATGQISLSIPPVQRVLSLEVTPEQPELQPGAKTAINVVVTGADGKPVPDAELAVVVVDEAILALSNYQMADLISIFYTDRGMDWDSTYGRASITLVDPQALAQANAQSTSAREMDKAAGAVPAPTMMAMAAPAAEMARDASAVGQPNAPINVRIDFNPLAAFAPTVHTDANGRARVEVKLPDNLTRYRVMVVAVEDGKRFGQGESNLVARLPLMVRPSAPRFLNFGDQFELPVVLQNQTDQPMMVDVAVRATNLEFIGPAGLRIEVPARDRVEVRFPAAAQMAGTARIQVAAASGDFADAATIDLPVYTPATTEAFATYGVIDEGAVAQPVAAPSDVYSQYGGLEVSTSSTALQSLTDAVLYLVAYPYDCSEQLASRILAVAALRDVLTAFQAQGLPSPEAMESAVQRDINTLKTIQNGDGGFPYWRYGQDSIPFNTIHVMHALARAQSKSFEVPADMQQRGLEYLRNIESYYPSWYGQQTRWTLSAYTLYVRNLNSDRDPQKALKLINEAGLENLSLDAVGWLWPVLEDAQGTGDQLEQIRRLVNNRVVETAGAANFTTSYDEQNYLLLGSNRRTDAILLDALIIDNPQHDLIPKVVNGLLAHRTRGRWGNTQENVFVLLAMDRYFNTFEAQTPDFVAKLWLGQNYAGSFEFKGRTTDRQVTDIPMEYLVNPDLGGGTQDLILSKEGTGRLYYRLGMTYAPTSLHLDSLDMGFIVKRVYEAVDNPEDVRQDSDGVWHIKAGARVRVRLTLTADNRRYHVALVDHLPAGLEIVNPSLAVSATPPQDPNQPEARSFWWWGTWYEHQNMRDERAEAFTTLLWDGVYEYTYIARATTPGQFVVPPAKAEEMYSPEVFGRSASDKVVIE